MTARPTDDPVLRRYRAALEAMMTLKLYEPTGRAGYLAGFHAAQALISERTDSSVKTHRGVRTELHRLTRDDPNFTPDLRSFLGRNYNLKTIADYEVGPEAEVSPDRAKLALPEAKRFVAYFEAFLAAS